MLSNNLQSGINILLAGADQTYSEHTISLFGHNNDSVTIRRDFWGLYDVGISKAFIQKDSLVKAFTIANKPDSANWNALYLTDQDSPLSVSGGTAIIGDASLPAAGVQIAFTDKPYTGDKKPVSGHIRHSEKTLPALNAEKLQQLEQIFTAEHNGSNQVKEDSTCNSFNNATVYINLGKEPATLKNKYLLGNIIIRSDTTVTIDSTVRLDNIMIFAKSILVNNGFKGNCQLFATDSVKIGRRCVFSYPSGVGVLNKKANRGIEPEIILDKNTVFSGIIFTSNKNKGLQDPKIVVEDGVKINGQIYSQSEVMFKGKAEITGSLYTIEVANFNSFRYSRNYLIDVKINGPALSSYYLASTFLPGAGKQKKILKWLQ